MSFSRIPPTGEESAHPDRRDGTRVPTIEPCGYHLAHFIDHESVEFTEGYALTLNTSPQGLLLLIPHRPESQQVFEVHLPASGKQGRVVKLVEACWTREVAFGTGGMVYLVGVKALFEPGSSMRAVP
ncbi:hypothetical protein [Nitrospira moscoviensis]|uniref:PilZ domain-containing protein n=1 Tax=Nitrospira moscoviensis TaxID=42253 RepID=A0A0K2GBZ4_NITMO|nr:hypothetical protein [Nitrospira moscoviensis]ALA58132.1 hypothetical protein NITMOv2_1712 [Nitrospira moscoviensis]